MSDAAARLVDSKPAPASAHPARCANCGAALTGRFCAACGQSVEASLRPVWELIEQALESLVHFDARGPRSLLLLLFRPGELTRQYIAGKRASFVQPVRFYILISLVFFLAIWATNTAIVQFVGFRTASGHEGVAFRLFSPLAAVQKDLPAPDLASRIHIMSDDEGDSPAWATRRIAALERALKEPTILNERMSELFPKMMFALVPVFGLVLWLLYVRRRRYLIEHLVFARHFHSFAFVLAALVIVVRPILPSGSSGGLFLVPAGLYLLLALKRVYGQGWVKTAIKEALLIAIYGISFAAGMLTLFFAGLGEI
jgi:hypothetical protein